MVENIRSFKILCQISIFCSGLIFFIICSGCTVSKIKYTKTGSPALKHKLNKSIQNIYPDRFKAIHRVLLTFSKKKYILNGYLSIDRSGRQIKLVAENDMGGVIFDVYYIENKKTTIKTNIAMIKKKWLGKTVLRDIKTIYLLKPFQSPTLFIDQYDNLILSQKTGSIIKELVYTSAGEQKESRLSQIRHLENGTYIYTVKFEYSNTSDNLYPQHILIHDKKMKYSVQINTRYFL